MKGLTNILKRLLLEHTSLIVMALGSGAIFLSNILYRGVLSSEDYGTYSIFVTYISIISSFGLLGFEQVFLRVTDNSQKDFLSTDRSLMKFMIIAWILFSFIAAIIFSQFFLGEVLNFWILFLCTLGIAFSMFLFNVFRINSNFVIAQMYSNYWKVAILLIFLFFLVFGSASIDLILLAICFIFVLASIYGGSFLIRNIKFNYQKKEDNKRIFLFAFQFFISLLTLSIIGQGDKFFVEKAFGRAQLGEYFFLANFFVFPFSMLQSYVGFKELVSFKASFSKRFFLNKIKNVNILGVLLSFALLFVSWISGRLGIMNINFDNNMALIVVFILIGISKLNYALMSAVFGAIGEVRPIFKANFQFILLSLLFLILFYGRMTSLLNVSIAILFMWILRIIIWNINILNQVNEN